MEKEIPDQDLKDVRARARQRKRPGQRPKAEVCLGCLRTAGDPCGCNRVTEGTDAAGKDFFCLYPGTDGKRSEGFRKSGDLITICFKRILW